MYYYQFTMPPRKYAGPLQPGKRSAYVPKSRKNRTRRTRAASTIQQAFRNYRRRTRAFVASAKPVAETKVIAGLEQKAIAPVTTFGIAPANSTIFRQYWDLANASPTPFGTALGCFTCRRGDNRDERNGDYIYGKKLLLNLYLQMVQTSENNTARNAVPIRFKVLVIKNRRSKAPYGTFKDPDKSLFLQPNGDEIGANTGLITQQMKVDDFIGAPLNKKNFMVYKHYNFWLSPPQLIQTGAADEVGFTSQKQYPMSKNIKMTLPVWSKLHYDNTSNNPDDYDGHYKILIYAMNQPSPDNASYWSSSLRSTFLYNDI